MNDRGIVVRSHPTRDKLNFEVACQRVRHFIPFALDSR
jgi:hypothetical protein